MQRLPRVYVIGLLLALLAASAGDCAGVPGVPGTSFPKTVAWTLRAVNNDANVRPAAAATADFDTDTLLDVVVGYAGFDATQPGVFIFFQTDVDNFTAVQILVDANLAGLTDLAVGDLNGDNRLDIVAACNGRLILMLSPDDPRQSASWSASVVDQSSADDIGQWNDVAIGNIDGLNGPDLVACGENNSRLSWFRSPSANPTSGTGWTRVDIDATTRTGAASVAIQDIDGDGRFDVYSTAAGEANARVAWYANPIDPQTQPWSKNTIGNLTAATRLAVGDLNADGLNDVVVTNPVGRQIGWYVRPADPTTAWSGFLIGQYSTGTPEDIQVVDVDGNNQPDVIVATRQPGSLRWFTPLSVQTDVWTENNLQDLTEDVGRLGRGDVDADGRVDVIAPLLGANTSLDRVAWFENPEP
ncbi:MAG: VCBS repeat-containing protein [Phycisphaerales bacterium]|nr:VCBS repeat-containing protein [Phycisphaerales bacterium]